MTKCEVIDFLANRRSVKVAELVDPAPDAATLKNILTIAMRVPDHGKLAPWKLVVLEKSGQMKLGELMAARFKALEPDANEKQIEFERLRPQRAPLLIAVIMTPKLGKIPLIEQQLSAGAVCLNLLQALHAHGFAGNWLTEWPAFDEEMTRALCSDEGAQIAGFIYAGTPRQAPEDRPRPVFDEVVRFWD